MARIARLLPKIPPNRQKLLATTLFGLAKKTTSTLEQRISAILSKYAGTLVLAGPDGLVVQGFPSNNYKESTGQTLASVDQQIGFVQDAAQTAQLLVSDDFNSDTGWVLGTGWSIAAGKLQHTAAGTARPWFTFNTTVDKYYVAEFTITEQSAAGSGVSFQYGSAGNLSVRTGVGTYREVFKAVGSTTTIGFIARGGSGDWLGSIDTLRYYELPGDHLTSVTAGYQPYLRRVPKELGPELVVGTGWSNATGITAVGAEIHFSAASGGASTNTGQAEVGVVHAVSYEIYEYSAGAVKPFLGLNSASVSGNSNGTRTDYIIADDNRIRIFVSTGPATLKVRNVSVRRVLSWSYVWQFDGVDDRMLFNSLLVPTANNFYHGFALIAKTNANNKTFADLSTNPSTGSRVGCLRINSANQLQVVHVNESGTPSIGTGSTITDNQAIVVEAVREGTNHKMYKDGVLETDTTLSGSYITTHSTIGGRGLGTSEAFLGSIYATIVLNGLPTSMERTDLKTFLANLQGRTLP